MRDFVNATITFVKDGAVGAYKSLDFEVQVKLNPMDYAYTDLALDFVVLAPPGYAINMSGLPSLSPGGAGATYVSIAVKNLKFKVTNNAGTAVDLPSGSNINVTIDVRVKNNKIIAMVEPEMLR